MASVNNDTKAKLAETAFRLFSQRGIDGVNLDAIAADAGVTKGSFYWHFKSKHEVVLGACAHYYRSYQRRVQREAAQKTDPVERLESVVRYSVRSCLLDAGNRIFTTEIFRLAAHDQEVRRGWQQFHDSIHEFYVALVVAATTTGGIKPLEADQAVDFMLATMEGLKLQALLNAAGCSAASERAICRNLMLTLGFPRCSR